MPRKTVAPPRLPVLPDHLPGEESISRSVDKFLDFMEREPLHKGINRLVDKIPIVPSTDFATPLGVYKTPEVYVPELQPARFDAKHREAFKAAVLSDVAELVDAIPFLGAAADPVSHTLEDNAYAKITETLTPQELTYFKSYDDVDPFSVIAMIRTMVRTQRES
jgi:hypothetical protein